MDRLRNSYIWGSLGVVDMRDKMTEHQLPWFDHVMRQGVRRTSSGLSLGVELRIGEAGK